MSVRRHPPGGHLKDEPSARYLHRVSPRESRLLDSPRAEDATAREQKERIKQIMAKAHANQNQLRLEAVTQIQVREREATVAGSGGSSSCSGGDAAAFSSSAWAPAQQPTTHTTAAVMSATPSPSPPMDDDSEDTESEIESYTAWCREDEKRRQSAFEIQAKDNAHKATEPTLPSPSPRQFKSQSQSRTLASSQSASDRPQSDVKSKRVKTPSSSPSSTIRRLDGSSNGVQAHDTACTSTVRSLRSLRRQESPPPANRVVSLSHIRTGSYSSRSNSPVRPQQFPKRSAFQPFSSSSTCTTAARCSAKTPSPPASPARKQPRHRYDYQEPKRPASASSSSSRTMAPSTSSRRDPPQVQFPHQHYTSNPSSAYDRPHSSSSSSLSALTTSTRAHGQYSSHQRDGHVLDRRYDHDRIRQHPWDHERDFSRDRDALHRHQHGDSPARGILSPVHTHRNSFASWSSSKGLIPTPHDPSRRPGDSDQLDSLSDSDFRHKVRVLIPRFCVKELIGKRGATMKQIGKESHSHFWIHDAGDPSRNISRPEEDCVLEISGTSRGICVAERLVIKVVREARTALDDPRYLAMTNNRFRALSDRHGHGWLRPLNLRDDEMHLPPETPPVTITQLPPEPSSHARHGRGEVTKYWMLRSEDVGKIIGKGGSIVTSICQATNTTIGVAIQKDMPIGCGERRVTVQGEEGSVKIALELIHQKAGGYAVDEHDRRRNQHRNQFDSRARDDQRSDYYDYGRDDSAERGSRHETSRRRTSSHGSSARGEYYALPNHFAAVLVTEKGQHVVKIREQSGARLQISHEQDMPIGSVNRVLHVTGSRRAIETAVELLESMMRDEGFLFDTQFEAEEIEDIALKWIIPSQIASSLLRNKGQLIQEITRKTRARAKFASPTENEQLLESVVTGEDNQDMRVCVLIGTVEQVLQAQRFILQVMASHAVSGAKRSSSSGLPPSSEPATNKRKRTVY